MLHSFPGLNITGSNWGLVFPFAGEIGKGPLKRNVLFFEHFKDVLYFLNNLKKYCV